MSIDEMIIYIESEIEKKREIQYLYYLEKKRLIYKIISDNINSTILTYSFKYQFFVGIIRFFKIFDSAAIIAGKGRFFYKWTIKNTILKPFIRIQ